jgi:hypothetical protein
MVWWIWLLIILGLFTFITGGIVIFIIGRFSNYKPGNSIRCYDLGTGTYIDIFPKSMRPSSMLGKVLMKKVGAFAIFNKEICIDTPYVETHKTFGKALFAVYPRDEYIKHVLGATRFTYDEYQMNKLELTDAKLALERLQNATAADKDDIVNKHLKMHYEHPALMFKPKKSGQGGSGGGGYGQNQY